MTIKLQNGGVIIDSNDNDNLEQIFLDFLENSEVVNTNISSSSALIFQLKLNDSIQDSPYSKFNINLFNKTNTKINNLLVKITITSNIDSEFTAQIPFPSLKTSDKLDYFYKSIYNYQQFKKECTTQQEIFIKTGISSILNNPSVKSDWNGKPIDVNLLLNPALDPATPGLVFFTNEKNDEKNYTTIDSNIISLSEFIFFKILSKIFKSKNNTELIQIINNIRNSVYSQLNDFMKKNSKSSQFSEISFKILVTEYIDEANFLDLSNISSKFYIPLSTFYMKSIKLLEQLNQSNLDKKSKQAKIQNLSKSIDNSNLFAKQIRTWSQVTLLFQFLRIIRDSGIIHFDLHLSNAICTFTNSPYIDTSFWTKEQWEFFPHSIDENHFNLDDLYKVKNFNSSSDINKLWPQFIYLKPLLIDWGNHYQLSEKEAMQFNELYDKFTDNISNYSSNLPKPSFNDLQNNYEQTKYILYLNELLFFIFKICKDNYAKCDKSGSVPEWSGSFNPPPEENISTKERFIPKISIGNRDFNITNQPFYQENIGNTSIITREVLLEDSFSWINKNVNSIELNQIQNEEKQIMTTNIWNITYPFTYLQCLICLTYNISQAFMLTNLSNVNPMKCCRTVINTLWNVFCPKLFFIDDPELNLLNIGLFTNLTEAGLSNQSLYQKYKEQIDIQPPLFPPNSIKDLERKEIIGGYDFSGQLQKMPILTNSGEPNIPLLQKNKIAKKFWFKDRYSNSSSLNEVQNLCKNSIQQWSKNYFLFSSPLSTSQNVLDSSQIIFKNDKFNFKKNGPKEDTLNGLYALSIYFHARIKKVEKEIQDIENNPNKSQLYQESIDKLLIIGNDLPETNKILQEQSQREFAIQQNLLNSGPKPIISENDKKSKDIFTETKNSLFGGEKYKSGYKKVQSIYDMLPDENKINVNNSIQTIKGIIGNLIGK